MGSCGCSTRNYEEFWGMYAEYWGVLYVLIDAVPSIRVKLHGHEGFGHFQ